DCIAIESTEVPGVGVAWSGSVEREALRDDADIACSARCKKDLAPDASHGEISDAAVQAILGAADRIATSLVLEQVSFSEGRAALADVIAGVTLNAAADDS